MKVNWRVILNKEFEIFSLTNDHRTVNTSILETGKLDCDSRKQGEVRFFTIIS